MAAKVGETVRNGHELAPLNTQANDAHHGVTIVLQGSRGSLQRGDMPGEDRTAWSGKLQFFLSIIGYSVGLGNIWRFPYLCQQNGGGAFLIPFLLMLVLEGVPLFLIEMAIGQKMRLGSLGVWNTIHPWLGGIGISSCIVTLFVALYYNVIITWVFFYLFNSLRYPLPWTSCPEGNGTDAMECSKTSETAYFWYRTALDSAPSIEQPGEPKWWIVMCLLLSWVIVFFIVMKGIQSSGKVVYFTSLFPYVVLTIFFVRGITLPGSGRGIMHMYTPKMEMLLDPMVWLDAATQVFYSFGLAFGSLIAFGSYNPPDNNCVRDVLLVSVCNALTAIYASLVIFSILGFKAYKMVEKCMVKEYKELLAVAGQLGYPGLLNITQPTEEQYGDAYGALLSHYNHTEINAIYNFTGCRMDKQLDEGYKILLTVAGQLGYPGLLNITQPTEEQYGDAYDALLSHCNHSEINAIYNFTCCRMDKQLDEAAEGTGLAFIVFTQAIGELWCSPFWSLIFFLMLLSLGLGSQIGIMEGMLCTIFDIEIFKRISKPYVTAVVCAFCFFTGLIFTTGAGEYWLKMFDAFAGTIGLVVIALMEMVSVVYVYGHERFSDDIRQMTGYRPGWYWQVTWRYVGPAIVSAILLSSLICMAIKPPSYGAWDADLGRVVKTPYPNWVLAIAMVMILAGILPIPLVALLRRFQCLGLDVDIHQGSIRRIETTVSTKEMMSDQDVMSPDYSTEAPTLLASELAPTARPPAAMRFTIGDFDDDSLDGDTRAAVRYEGESSSDDEVPNSRKLSVTRKIAMRFTGGKPTAFKMEIVPE